MKKVVVSGCRYFNNKPMIEKYLNEFLKNYNKDEVKIISAGAAPIDFIVEDYAKENGIELEILDVSDRSLELEAIQKRNSLLVEKSDLLIAFWDIESLGTKHFIKEMAAAKKEIKLVPIVSS